MSNTIIKWVECDGGPHILLEKRLISMWKGSYNDRYYDSACEIEDYIGLLPIGDGQGIIISEDVSRSTWITSEDKAEGYIVVLNYIKEDSEDDLIIREIRNISNNIYIPSGINITIQDSYLYLFIYLFSACDNGADWSNEYIEVKLEPGKYLIDTVENHVFDNCSFRVHRFRKLSNRNCSDFRENHIVYCSKKTR